MITLPYKIDKDWNIEEFKKKFSLKPSKNDESYSENMKAYNLLKIDVQFLYKTIKQKNKARYQGKWMEVITKITNAI